MLYEVITDVEISGLRPQQEVGGERSTPRDVLAEQAVFVGQQGEPADREHGQQNQGEGASARASATRCC